MNLKVFSILFVVATAANKVYGKSCMCGRENIDSRIVGGTRVSQNQYPWMASLRIDSSRGSSACGGALINNRYILTAAHCIDNSPTRITATLGTNNKYYGGKRIQIVDYKMHRFNSHRLQNDIALLKLSEPVEFTKEISPICLPTTDMMKFEQLTVAGWGYTRPGGSPSSELLEVTVNEYPFDRCNREWGYRLLSSQICAADIGKDSCGGDSGGPLMYRSRGKMSVVGVVSYGSIECGTTRNSVYTRVTSFLDWIQSNTGDAEYCDN